jgi:hypothetical protein
MTRPRRLYVTKDNRFYYLINGKKKFIKVPEGMTQKQLQKVNITNIIGGPMRRLKRKTKKIVPVYSKKIAKGEDMQKSVIKTTDGLPTYIFTPQKKFLSLGDVATRTDDTSTSKLVDLLKGAVPLITEGVKKLSLPAPEQKFMLQDADQELINEMIEGKLLQSEPYIKEFIRREIKPKPSSLPRPPLLPKPARPSPRPSPVATPISTPLREEEDETIEPPASFLKPSMSIPIIEEIEEPSLYKEAFDINKLLTKKNLRKLGYKEFVDAQKDSSGKTQAPYNWNAETLINFGREIGLDLKKGTKKEELKKEISQKLQSGKGKGKDDGLYNDQIEYILGKRIKNFVPVVASDKVEELLKYVRPKDKFFSAVINTEPSSLSGRHWRCIVIDNRDDFPSAEYFDPLAEDFKPEDKLLSVMKKITKRMNPEKYFKFKFSLIRRQDFTKSNCGFHCMKFIEDRYNGIPFSEASGWNNFTKQKGGGYQAPDDSQDGEGDLKSYEKMIKNKFDSYI